MCCLQRCDNDEDQNTQSVATQLNVIPEVKREVLVVNVAILTLSNGCALQKPLTTPYSSITIISRELVPKGA